MIYHALTSNLSNHSLTSSYGNLIKGVKQKQKMQMNASGMTGKVAGQADQKGVEERRISEMRK